MRVWRSLFGVTEPAEEPLEGRGIPRRDHGVRDVLDPGVRGRRAEAHVFEDLHWCDEASMDS